MDLRKTLGLTILFISHDLSVIGQISDRIAVMYLGRIVELADAGALFTEPSHPYTRALIASIPRPDPARRTMAAPSKGEPPSRLEGGQGCSYADRCPIRQDRCLTDAPSLQPSADGRLVACHFA
jgi:oligopeptide/dipeptide ABC transporter ATP-binding protein